MCGRPRQSVRGRGERGAMEERNDWKVFDQQGAESHWDVMERLVLCNRRVEDKETD